MVKSCEDLRISPSDQCEWRPFLHGKNEEVDSRSIAVVDSVKLVPQSKHEDS